MTEAELARFYAGKRALITGGLGFIGSNLARRLVELGCSVAIVDALMPTQGGHRHNVAGIEDQVLIELSDVREDQAVRSLVADSDLIFNLVGQTSHLDSMLDPHTDVEINCSSQLSILEACRAVNPTVKVVFASTRQIYGRPRQLPVDERHPIAPVDINGINKTAGEWYHLLYARVYGLRVCVLRLTNTYGPRMRVRDERQTFLGVWIRDTLCRRPFLVFGDGSQLRDFNYVDDAVGAFLVAAADSAADGRIYNLGATPPVSLAEVAGLLAEAGARYRFESFPPDRASIDIGSYYANYDRIREELGWSPRIDLKEGLRRTLAFFKENGHLYWSDE